MPTHAEVSARLLQESARFFETLGADNPRIAADMAQNARIYGEMAQRIHTDPSGVLDGDTHGYLAGQLLSDAADFFEMLGEENEDITAQMQENARIYRIVAELVTENPLGEID